MRILDYGKKGGFIKLSKFKKKIEDLNIKFF